MKKVSSFAIECDKCHKPVLPKRAIQDAHMWFHPRCWRKFARRILRVRRERDRMLDCVNYDDDPAWPVERLDEVLQARLRESRAYFARLKRAGTVRAAPPKS